MEYQSQWQGKIDKYMRNLMNEEEKAAFEQEIKANPELAQEVALQQDLMGGVRTLGNRSLKSKLQEMHHEVAEIRGQQQNRRRRLLLWRGAAAAAVIFIALFFYQYVFNQSTSPDQLFAEYYQAYELNLQNRGQDLAAPVLEADQLYQEQNYTAALPLLQAALNTDPQNTQLLLALGICKIESQQYTAALADFQRVLDLNDPLLDDQANWYMALIHLQQNQPALARPLLEKLAANAAADHHADAQEILKEFK